MPLKLGESFWVLYTDKGCSKPRVGCIIDDCAEMDNEGNALVVKVEHGDNTTALVRVECVLQNVAANCASGKLACAGGADELKLVDSDHDEKTDDEGGAVSEALSSPPASPPVSPEIKLVDSDHDEETEDELSQLMSEALSSPPASPPVSPETRDDEQVAADANKDTQPQKKRPCAAPESEKGLKKTKKKQAQTPQQEEEAAQAHALVETDNVEDMVEQILTKSGLDKHANWLEQPPERVEVTTTDPLYAELDGETPLEKLRSFAWERIGKDAMLRARMDKLVRILFLVMATETDNYSDLASALAYFKEADPKKAIPFLCIRVLNKRCAQETLAPVVQHLCKTLALLGS